MALVLLFLAHTDAAGQGGGKCSAVGGLIMTNLGVIDANTTLGIATGDLACNENEKDPAHIGQNRWTPSAPSWREDVMRDETRNSGED